MTSLSFLGGGPKIYFVSDNRIFVKRRRKKNHNKTEVFTLSLKSQGRTKSPEPQGRVARETAQLSSPQPWEARALHILLIVEAKGLLLPLWEMNGVVWRAKMAGEGGQRLAATSWLLRGSQIGQWDSHEVFLWHQADRDREGEAGLLGQLRPHRKE